MCSHRIIFMPSDVSRAVLEIIPDGLSTSITKVEFYKYRLLARSSYRAIECSSY